MTNEQLRAGKLYIEAHDLNKKIHRIVRQNTLGPRSKRTKRLERIRGKTLTRVLRRHDKWKDTQ